MKDDVRIRNQRWYYAMCARDYKAAANAALSPSRITSPKQHMSMDSYVLQTFLNGTIHNNHNEAKIIGTLQTRTERR